MLIDTGRRPSRNRLATLLLFALSCLVALCLAEGLLRLADYRFSPIVFVAPDNDDDHRPFHMGGPDRRLRASPLTLPDPDLLWRPDPRASAELTSEGFRGDPIPEQRPRNGRLIVALGDSNTLGPLGTADHWPGFLEDLLRANRGSLSFQVVNAGVYGYSALQGLLRFRQIRRFRPDVVYFSFGANDAQPVNATDAAYAARVERVRSWDRLRLAPPFFNLVWRIGDALEPRHPLTRRVPLDDYRRILQTFIDEARADGAVPILLTRPLRGPSSDQSNLLYEAPRYNEVVRAVAAANGTPLLETWALLAREPEHFTDGIHNDRIGYRHIAEAALTQLHELGVVESDDRRNLAPSLDLSSADERHLELGPGFWQREPWPGSRGGRWTGAEATVELSRPTGESRLVVDLSCYRPSGLTLGQLEVDGHLLGRLPEANGRHRIVMPLAPYGGARVVIRFVVPSAYRPSDLQSDSRDSRLLGVFVHEVTLEATGR